MRGYNQNVILHLYAYRLMIQEGIHTKNPTFQTKLPDNLMLLTSLQTLTSINMDCPSLCLNQMKTTL